MLSYNKCKYLRIYDILYKFLAYIMLCIKKYLYSKIYILKKMKVLILKAFKEVVNIINYYYYNLI